MLTISTLQDNLYDYNIKNYMQGIYTGTAPKASNDSVLLHVILIIGYGYDKMEKMHY